MGPSLARSVAGSRFPRAAAGLALVLAACGEGNAVPAGESLGPVVNAVSPGAALAEPAAAALLAAAQLPAPTLGEGFAPVLERAMPAVVNVAATKLVTPQELAEDPILRDFLRGHGGMLPQEPMRQQGVGSGVIVSRDGYVLTNNHVVEGASEVTITLADRRRFEARVVGSDPKTDLAVLKVEARDLPTLALGDSSRVRVGEIALALGDPFGLGPTATQGIISAVGRGEIGIADYEDFLQTDAAINPGNSGGALINGKGELIGINTAIISSSMSGGNQGIGFAVPTELARGVMDQIITHGRVVRGWIGVAIQDVTPPLAKALGLSATDGALVSDVAPGSPGAKAGLARGDVVVELDGGPVTGARELRNRIGAMQPGKDVALGVLRGNDRRKVTLRLAEQPSDGDEGTRRPAEEPGQQSTPELGLEVAPLDPALAQRLGLPRATRGVAVVDVDLGGRARQAGIRPGDVILEVNKQPVKDPADLTRILQKSRGGAVVLLVQREGSTRYLVVEPQHGRARG